MELKNIIKIILKKNNLIYFLFYILRARKNLKLKKVNFNIIDSYKWFNQNNNDHVIVPTFPSSGWNYVDNVLNYYYNKKIFGSEFFKYDKENYYLSKKFKFRIADPADVRGIKCLNEKMLTPFKLIHTQTIVSDTPYLRYKLKFNKKVFIIRDPLSTLYSFFNKLNQDNFFNFIIEQKNLYRFINFYNSYSPFILNYKNTHLVFSYNLNQNKEITFRSLINFLDKKKIDELILKEAINFFSFEKELKKNNKQGTNFYKGLKNYENKISDNLKDIIFDELRKKLNKDIYVFFKTHF